MKSVLKSIKVSLIEEFLISHCRELTLWVIKERLGVLNEVLEEMCWGDLLLLML